MGRQRPHSLWTHSGCSAPWRPGRPSAARSGRGGAARSRAAGPVNQAETRPRAAPEIPSSGLPSPPSLASAQDLPGTTGERENQTYPPSGASGRSRRATQTTASPPAARPSLLPVVPDTNTAARASLPGSNMAASVNFKPGAVPPLAPCPAPSGTDRKRVGVVRGALESGRGSSRAE